MMNWKGCERNRKLYILRYYQGMFLDGLKKNAKYFSLRNQVGTQDVRCDILTAMAINIAVFWAVEPYS
jgi:hypothetical protein